MSNQLEKIKELIDRRAVARQGGGEKAIAKQHDKGKYTARERIAMLLDEGLICRTAADQAAELNETGQVGLLRLAEVWRAIRAKEGMGGLILEGTEAKILSDVVAQFYAYLSGCMFNDPVGMAIYAELHYMMSSLMLGEWFE